MRAFAEPGRHRHPAESAGRHARAVRRRRASSEAETARAIVSTYQASGELIDPHTAVAVSRRRRRIGPKRRTTPLVALATAHPAKFPRSGRERRGRRRRRRRGRSRRWRDRRRAGRSPAGRRRGGEGLRPRLRRGLSRSLRPHIHMLANGVRVVCDPMPGLETLALTVVVGRGALHETRCAVGLGAPARAHGVQGAPATARRATSSR